MIYEKRGIAAQMPQFLDNFFEKIILTNFRYTLLSILFFSEHNKLYSFL